MLYGVFGLRFAGLRISGCSGLGQGARVEALEASRDLDYIGCSGPKL